MEDFAGYLLMMNVLLMLAALYFRFVLRHQPRFRWNRVFILGASAAAILLPLLRLEVLPEAVENPVMTAVLPVIVIGSPTLQPAAAPSMSWLEIFGILYGMGAGISLVWFSWNHARILRMIAIGSKTRQGNLTLIHSERGFGPASYFRYIFWNDRLPLSPQDAAVAMAHETCHARQGHTYDLVFMGLLQVVCWFNPVIYLLRKDLRQTHEYLADEAAKNVAGVDGIKRLLLVKHLHNSPIQAAHYFHSYAKQRLIMLAKTSRKSSLLPYLLTAPLLAMMVACSSAGPQPSSENPALTKEVRTEASASPAYDNFTSAYNLEDVLMRANMGTGMSGPRDKALVCMGTMPQVLDLSTQPGTAEQAAAQGQPFPLNLARVVELIGYPAAAKEQKIEGQVMVKVLVDETGRVVRYIFQGENHPLLQDAVAAHIEKLAFKPGLENGKPAEWWVLVPIWFGKGGC